VFNFFELLILQVNISQLQPSLLILGIPKKINTNKINENAFKKLLRSLTALSISSHVR